MKILKVNLRDWRQQHPGFDLPESKVPFVVQFLARFRNLRVLELSCFSQPKENILSAMATHCDFVRMEVCGLSLFEIRLVQDLLDFLRPAKDSLRCLSLSNIRLKDENVGWNEVLRCMAADLALDKIDIRNAYTILGPRIGFGRKTQRRLLLEGATLKEELMASAESLVYGERGSLWPAAVAYPFIAP